MAEPSEITVTMPADLRFVALARVTAASLAVELDFSVDQIDELRIGVDELVTMLVESAGEQPVELRYRLSDTSIEIDGSSASSEDLSDQLDAITRQIFESVVDRWELGPGCGTIEKRLDPT